jgi:hypothetical protein
MNPDLDAGAIERAVKDLVIAEPSNLGVEVTLPVAYPGGDLITVIVERSEASVLVHDAGFASMRLANSGVKLSRSVVTRLQEYAKRFNSVFLDGRVSAKCDLDNVGICATLVANASRSVADYMLEIRHHAEADFRNTISDNLREIMGGRLRENEEIRGASGRKYRVPITLLDQNEAVPTNFIGAVSSRNIVPNIFSMLYDIKGVYQNSEFDSIYDESGDIRNEDKTFLMQIGPVLSVKEAKVKFRSLASIS